MAVRHRQTPTTWQWYLTCRQLAVRCGFRKGPIKGEVTQSRTIVGAFSRCSAASAHCWVHSALREGLLQSKSAVVLHIAECDTATVLLQCRNRMRTWPVHAQPKGSRK
jgi:hypothetical protein